MSGIREPSTDLSLDQQSSSPAKAVNRGANSAKRATKAEVCSAVYSPITGGHKTCAQEIEAGRMF